MHRYCLVEEPLQCGCTSRWIGIVHAYIYTQVRLQKKERRKGEKIGKKLPKRIVIVGAAGRKATEHWLNV